jgi:hypothetical protein
MLAEEAVLLLPAVGRSPSAIVLHATRDRNVAARRGVVRRHWWLSYTDRSQHCDTCDKVCTARRRAQSQRLHITEQNVSVGGASGAPEQMTLGILISRPSYQY